MINKKKQCYAGLFTYKEYLKSEIWNDIKEYWVNVVGQCEYCRCSNKNFLTIHHLNYKNCGNEQREDILILCNFCHIDLHNKNFIDIKKRFVENIRVGCCKNGIRRK